MLFKDLSELHNTSLEFGKPGLFDDVLEGAIREALGKPPSPQSHRGDGDGGFPGRLVWFDCMGRPAPQKFLAEPAIPEAYPTILYGAGGSAKSILATELAIRVAGPGGLWLGNRVYGGHKALVMDFELNANTFNSRVGKLVRGMGLDRGDLRGLAYYEVGDASTEEAFGEVEKAASDFGFDLLVVDSVGPALVGDTTNARDVIGFYRSRISPLLALGTTVLLIDHQARSHTDEDYQTRGVYGSAYKEYLARSVFQVQPQPTPEGSNTLVLRMRHRKANFTRLQKPYDVWVTFDEEEISVERRDVDDSELITEKTVHLESRILNALGLHSQGTAAKIAEWVGATNQGSVGNALRSLKRNGRVVEAGKEGNALVYALSDEDPSPNPPSPHPPSEYGDGGDLKNPPYPPEQNRISKLFSGFDPRYVADEVGLRELVTELDQADTVAIDVETGPWDVGLDPVRCTPGALSVTTDRGYTAVVNLNRVDPSPVLGVLEGKTLLGHYLRFDLRVLRHSYGYEHPGSAHDTYVLRQMVHFADGERKLEDGKNQVPQFLPKLEIVGGGGKKERVGGASLRGLVWLYFGFDLSKDEQSSDWLAEEFSREQIAYAGKDTFILFGLWRRLKEDYYDVAGKALVDLGRAGEELERVLELEASDRPAKVWMEANGFAIDTEKWRELAKHYTRVTEETSERLKQLSGRELNLDSDAQVIEVLSELGAEFGKVPKTAKTGRPSLARGNISKVTGGPEVEEFIELHIRRKEAAKYASTYGFKWLLSPDEMAERGYKKQQIPHHQFVVGGRVRSIFELARTGRDRSGEPNLQNLPSASKSAHRAALEVPEGRCLLIADYRQIELVVLSIIAGDGEMYAALKDPERDLHSEMVRKLWGIADDGSKEFEEKRKKAKNVNFGRAYLRGASSISKLHGIPEKEAKALIKAYDDHWQGVHRWHRREKGLAGRLEKTVTLTGRVRKISTSKFKGSEEWSVYVPEWVNHQVQGTAGDGMKTARVRMYRDRHGVPGNPLLVDSVHDEFVVECDVEHGEEVSRWLERHMVGGMRDVLKDPEAPVAVELKRATNYAGVAETDGTDT